MKNTIKLVIIGALVTMGMALNAGVNAQTTNVVLTLNVALSGVKQDGEKASPVRISSKDIIAAIGEFGKNAKLVAISSVDGEGGPTLVIREKTGTNIVDTPIGDFLQVGGHELEVSSQNAQYSILSLSFGDGTGNDFAVDGFSTQRKGKVTGRGIGVISDITTAVAGSVSGDGHVGGDAVVLKGSVSAGAPKAEVSGGE